MLEEDWEAKIVTSITATINVKETATETVGIVTFLVK